MGDALIVFARPPIAGRVKTRLQSLLSGEDAAELYRAFLADSLRQYSTIDKQVFLYFSAEPDSQPDGSPPPDVVVCRQRGEGLAERLRNAFLDVFSQGAGRVVVVGTDHPSLPTEFVLKAFEVLMGTHDIVIGPSEDGGYYLLGMSDFHPVLFDGMKFSHDRVFDETVDRAASTRARLTVLPLWYDIDTPEQLPRLWSDLRRVPDQAPATLTMLRELADRFNWQ